MTPQEFKSLKRICLLTYAEVLHLKKRLIQNDVIKDSDIHDFPNSLGKYMEELDAKERELIKEFHLLGDQQ